MKTLKDFDAEDSCENNGYQECKDVLRAEAIKWIKELSVVNYAHYTEFITGRTEKHLNGAISFIKHFFNIENKDLE